MIGHIKQLHVFLYQTHIGLLREDPDGRHSFTYDVGYRGPALSLSMPFRREPWTGAPIEAYIDGILPDDRSVRAHIGYLYDVSPRNPFALLTAVGFDCGGAVQFISDEQLKDPSIFSAEYIPISEEQISRRLADFSGQGSPSWQNGDEHWSLNGAQDKIALARLGDQDQWFEARGTAATTHILKPGVRTLREQAFDEYPCLKMLQRLGIHTAESCYRSFGGIPAIISKRWDRYDAGGTIIRIHQEDMCQAMSVMTDNKYQSDGGPSAVDIIHFIRRQGFERGSDLLFFQALVANYLIGGSDAHAKNYAILEFPERRPMLAPLYDIASIYPYGNNPGQLATARMAMSIGGQNKWGNIRGHEWERFAEQCGGRDDAEILRSLLYNYAESLPDIFHTVAQEEIGRLAEAGETGAMMTGKQKLVEQSQKNLDDQCRAVSKWFR